jgi:hypothetical protein
VPLSTFGSLKSERQTILAVAMPQHEIATENVEVPTVLVKTLRAYGGDQTVTGVHLQWFGQSMPRQVPRGSQFFFPLNRQAGDICWQGKLETFRVAFVGQLKDWPNPAAAQSIADSIGHGSLDGWVVYLVSGEVVVFRPPDPGQREPTSFLLPLPVMLADPNCGIITPKPYDNRAVVDEEMDKANPCVEMSGL